MKAKDEFNLAEYRRYSGDYTTPDEKLIEGMVIFRLLANALLSDSNKEADDAHN